MMSLSVGTEEGREAAKWARTAAGYAHQAVISQAEKTIEVVAC